MRSFKGVYLNKKGFSLLEMILGICITSILIMCLYSVLHFSMNTLKSNDLRDDMLLNGRYALIYIKEEINSADKIIHISKFKNLDSTYPVNIGFVILKKTGQSININYNYITYYLKEDSLFRVACNIEGTDKYPSNFYNGGNNKLFSNIKSLDKFIYNEDKNILSLKLTSNNGQEDFEFKSDIYLNCPIDLDNGGENE